MSGIERIRTVSRRLRVACTLVMAALPVAVALFWININDVPGMSRQLPVSIDADLPALNAALGFLVTMIPVSVFLLALSHLRRLLGLYYQGRVFEPENVRCYRRLGWAIIGYVGASFLSQPLLSVVLTFHRPEGQRLLTVGLSSDHVAGLLFGAVMLLISWVMDDTDFVLTNNLLCLIFYSMTHSQRGMIWGERKLCRKWTLPLWPKPMPI